MVWLQNSIKYNTIKHPKLKCLACKNLLPFSWKSKKHYELSRTKLFHSVCQIYAWIKGRFVNNPGRVSSHPSFTFSHTNSTRRYSQLPVALRPPGGEVLPLALTSDWRYNTVSHEVVTWPIMEMWPKSPVTEWPVVQLSTESREWEQKVPGSRKEK